MRENHLLTERGKLLDEKGNIAEPGYATSLIKEYDRKDIKASPLRIKEWDYYYVGNARHGVALTVADNGYMSLLSASVLDFEKPSDITVSKMGWLTKGKLKLPSSSASGDVLVKGKGYAFRFAHEGGARRLVVDIDNFYKGDAFHCDILLQETTKDTLVVATPFKKEGHFYYNQKINCLRAHGYARIGAKNYDFNDNCFGVLDWGRGVWTYKNTWYWSSLSAESQGHVIGWNLGYGFGDTKAASENMLYLDGKSCKIGDIRMNIPMGRSGRDDFMKPWRIKDYDGALDVEFTPVYDRHSDTNLLLLRSNQHQVFGLFSGHLRFDDKDTQIDSLPGFAEKVFNKW